MEGTKRPVSSVSLLLWGPLVLVSVLAFHYRTRGRCHVCHQL